MLSACSTSYCLLLAPTLWLREPCTHCSDRKTEVNVLIQGHKAVVAAVELHSHVWLFVTPWTAARQASLSFIISWNLLKLMSIELVMPSNHLILCLPLLLVSLIFLTINVFSNESVLHIRWPKYWSFSIGPSHEYSGLISFRIDWFDLFCSPVCRREEQITSTQSYFCS